MGRYVKYVSPIGIGPNRLQTGTLPLIGSRGGYKLSPKNKPIEPESA